MIPHGLRRQKKRIEENEERRTSSARTISVYKSRKVFTKAVSYTHLDVYKRQHTHTHSHTGRVKFQKRFSVF